MLILCYDLATRVPFVLSWVEAVEERQRHRYVVVAESHAEANGVDERREVEEGSEVATVVVSDAEEEQVVIHATQHHTPAAER